MKMRKISGKKNEHGKDLPLQICTDGWEIITVEDTLTIIDSIFENEDRIYPRPKLLGASMFFNEIVKRYANYMNEKNETVVDNM